jgi:hypothetical protein
MFAPKLNLALQQGAYLQLSILEACMQEIKDMESGNTVRLCTLGQAIRDAKYTSEYSSWTYPKPAEVSSGLCPGLCYRWLWPRSTCTGMH